MIDDAPKSVVGMTSTEHICTAHKDEIFCFAVIGDKNKNIIYSNLTGKFPARSFNGMCYIFLAYVYRLKPILLQPMK